MEKICLDFEIALDFLRGDPATIEKLKYYADREEICITSLTMMHLMESVSKPEVVAAFASNVTILPFDKKAAQVAAKIMNEMKERGDVPRVTDSVLTAAVCMANDAFIFSRANARFDGIKGLRKV
ncbi:MAG: PIN domain-containing protein [Candidatus Micrarchaeia archaeon]